MCWRELLDLFMQTQQLKRKRKMLYARKSLKRAPASCSVLAFPNYHTANVRPLISFMFMVPSSLCSVASFRMQVHLAQDSVALAAEWPNRVPRARPSVQGPQGPTPYPPYLLQFIWAAMAAICEAVGKQMLFFHLWNQVFGKQSAFWWPESSNRV